MTAPLRIGIAGLGTVGAATVRLLRDNADLIAARAGRPIEIVAVSARDRSRDRGIALDGIDWVDDPVALARRDDIDAFVELIGGEAGPAFESVTAALAAGRHVVTANKALLAHHGNDLARTAQAAGAALHYEASVAGGIPIVKALREGAAANRITRVFGILNGTCNYILTRMEREGLDFETCLAEAQRLGYAEADPTFDIGGFDAAHKLAILAALAFGTEVDIAGVHIEGISSITPADLKAAEELGYRIKLLGVARVTRAGIEQRVTPTMVPLSAAMAEIHGVLNAVAFDGDAVREVMLVGPGAGGDATASAVVADLVDLARGHVPPMFGRSADGLVRAGSTKMREHTGSYYMRLAVHDRPGAFAAIATRMAEAGISLESIVQKSAHDLADDPGQQGGDGMAGQVRPVVLITHDTTEAHMRAAMAAIESDGHVAGKPYMIRIEPAVDVA